MNGYLQGMRKWSAIAAAFILTVAMVCVLDIFSTVSLADSGKTNANAKVRKDASTNSTAVGAADKGTTVEITGEKTGTDGKVWYKVVVNGTEGYIRSDLVDKTGTSSGTDGNQTTKPITSADGVEQVTPVTATVSGGNAIRVRTSASTANSNNILTTVASGTSVTVVARLTGTDDKLWYQVKLTVNNKEVIGYIRSDYLTLAGEVKPLEEGTAVPQEDEKTPESGTDSDNTETKTDTNVPQKRYETKLVNDQWYILDYEQNKQYDIEQIFAKAREEEELYTAEKAKTGKLKVALTIFIILALLGFGCAGYMFYRIQDMAENSRMKSYEESVPKRTAERPRNGARTSAQSGAGREKPVIREGVETRKEEAQRPVQNGQRQTVNRAQQNAQRQTVQNGQRPQGGQAAGPAQAQGGQRPQTAAGQTASRPAGAQQAQGASRPVNAAAQKAPVPPVGQRPVKTGSAQPQGSAQQAVNRTRNFVQDDELEFDFQNWDSDDD